MIKRSVYIHFLFKFLYGKNLIQLSKRIDNLSINLKNSY